ncbi:hypothetical protein [Microbacterium maritypicum]
MTSSETTTRRASALLPGAYRVVRRLAAEEGPFVGALVSDGEEKAVLRDAEGLSGWGGWPYAGAQHVAAPMDVVRRADGHDVLLPWCTERITVFLGRRARQGNVLTAGEISTLVVSVLRGVGELDAGPPGARRGEWWLTDEGCPVVVIGEDDDARVTGARLVEAVAAETTDRAQRRLLDGIAEGLRRFADRPEVPRRQLDIWETELLSVAAPRPLSVAEDTAPDTSAAGAVHRIVAAEPFVHRRAERRAERRRISPAQRSEARMRDVSAPPVRARVAMLVRTVLVSVRTVAASAVAVRRPRRGVASMDEERGGRPGGTGPARRRVPKLLVGAVAAGAVIAAGLLWPGGGSDGPAGGDSAAGGARHVETPAAADVPTEPSSGGAEEQTGVPLDPAPEPGARSGGDLEVIGARVVAAVRACVAARDDTCAAAVVPGAGHVVDLFEAASQRDEGDESIQVVDEYGGAAVLRLSTGAEAGKGAEAGSGAYARMLVLVQVDEKWLVRDAYDVADQPG